MLYLYLHDGRVPLPALSNAGQGPVDTGEAQQEDEHQRHRGCNQTQHVARRGVPLVGGHVNEFIPAVEVAVRSAYQQGQVAQLGLVGGGGESGQESSEEAELGLIKTGVQRPSAVNMEQAADLHCCHWIS